MNGGAQGRQGTGGVAARRGDGNADGSAKTRMAYLGCVFTQHQRDEKGRPIRDYQSTTYVSSFGSIDAFGPQLRQDVRNNSRVMVDGPSICWMSASRSSGMRPPEAVGMSIRLTVAGALR